MDDTLEICTIYFNPSDFPPDSWVVRLWLLDKPTTWFRVENSLEAIREHIPDGLYRMDRQEGDDPVIVETWF